MFGYFKYLGSLAAVLSLLAAPIAAMRPGYIIPPPPSIPCIMYEVRAGDYCYKIAVVNGISYQQFLAQNPGIDCTRLRIGQSVCLIPLTISGNWGKGLYSGDAEGAATNEEESAGLKASTQCQAYTVQPGDVCSQIAENNDISVTKLVELNQSVPSWSGCSSLQVGQKVCIA